MNPALLVNAVAEVDQALLETLLKLEAILAATPLHSPAWPALAHAQETIACLSAGLEELAARIQLEGPANPSFN